MSDITPLSPRTVPEGYAQRTIQVDGQEMSFTFYLGFASRVSYTPPRGTEILVYQQEGVFQVPGGGNPAAACKLWITGGPDELDVEMDIDDSPRPAPSFRGPIESIDITTRRVGGGASNPRARPVRGGDRVAAVRVQLRAGGGVHPHMPEDGGTTTVVNTAQTCPPTCG